jgi:hypothetical protein
VILGLKSGILAALDLKSLKLRSLVNTVAAKKVDDFYLKRPEKILLDYKSRVFFLTKTKNLYLFEYKNQIPSLQLFLEGKFHYVETLIMKMNQKKTKLYLWSVDQPGFMYHADLTMPHPIMKKLNVNGLLDYTAKISDIIYLEETQEFFLLLNNQKISYVNKDGKPK